MKSSKGGPWVKLRAAIKSLDSLAEKLVEAPTIELRRCRRYSPPKSWRSSYRLTARRFIATCNADSYRTCGLSQMSGSRNTRSSAGWKNAASSRGR